MASQIGSTGGAPGGTGGAGFLRRCVLGSTSGAPVGSTAEIAARLRRRLKSSCTERGTRRRSMPWMTPSGLSTASGRVTAAWPTRMAPSPAAASSISSPESVGWDAAGQEAEGSREGRTW
uniref:Uncharacterized protein n=1 Tax=Arundo donax TaxID=35708 RepID=A0A0A9EJG9_ARUDO